MLSTAVLVPTPHSCFHSPLPFTQAIGMSANSSERNCPTNDPWRWCRTLPGKGKNAATGWKSSRKTQDHYTLSTAGGRFLILQSWGVSGERVVIFQLVSSHLVSFTFCPLKGPGPNYLSQAQILPWIKTWRFKVLSMASKAMACLFSLCASASWSGKGNVMSIYTTDYCEGWIDDVGIVPHTQAVLKNKQLWWL